MTNKGVAKPEDTLPLDVRSSSVSSTSIGGSLNSPTLISSTQISEKCLSPLDSIHRRAADDFTSKHSVGSNAPDMDKGGGTDRGSLRGPSISTARMPFHGDEYFTETAQLSPEISGNGTVELVKDGSRTMNSQARLLLDGQPSRTSSRSVSFASPTTIHSYPSPGKGSDSGWPNHPRLRGWKLDNWHPSFNMYICFLGGILFAVGHHIFYALLDGKTADNQSEMLRYGTILAYVAKAGFSTAVILAFEQRVWVTVRSRFMSIGALDSMFAAAEGMVSMLDFEFLRHAKAAYALALFAWTTPLVVILTSNTLLVQLSTMAVNGTCPSVRTLDFALEETFDWRDPMSIDGLFEIPVSIWNTTKRDDSDTDWFDYYTGPSPAFQSIATLGSFLQETISRKNASSDTCGAGWNCTFTIEYTAPGYNCTEMASGVGSVPGNLSQESGEAVSPFPNTDFLLPRGNFSYYAFTSGGEYSQTQLDNVSVGGIPMMDPSDIPETFGALRTEPLVWVGYSIQNNKNRTQPTRNDSGWDDAFTPKIFACEHRETAYVANITYVNTLQIAKITSRKFGPPIINTTFLPDVMATDNTDDNTTAVPESNYIFPRDTARYRRIAAYHSLGKMLRTFMNGTITVPDALPQAIANTQAIQTKLLDPRNNYFPYTNLMDRVQSMYDDIILSMFSNPQLVEVTWAGRLSEENGTLSQVGEDELRNGSAYMYPCTRFRTINTYTYHKRDLWIVYGMFALATLACVVAGALAIRDNGNVTRNTQFSSIVAATRGPALEGIAWMGPLQDRGDVPSDVKRLKLGYGVMNDMHRKTATMDMGPDPNLKMDAEGERTPSAGRSSTYSSGYKSEMRCGFGMKGDVDQRHREGSLFHR